MKPSQALAIIRKTKENYNAIVSDWHQSRLKGPSAIKLKLLDKIRPGEEILDIGCGDGFIIPTVLKKGGKYFGTDIAEKLLAIAKTQFKKEIKSGSVALTKSDASNRLPYVNNKFDQAFSFAVLHHIPSEPLRVQFLREVYRVLKPGGQAAIVVWNLRDEWCEKRFKIKEQLKNGVEGLGENDVYVPWKATAGKIVQRYLHVFDGAELKRLARAAGFKKIKTEYYDQNAQLAKNGEELVLKLQK